MPIPTGKALRKYFRTIFLRFRRVRQSQIPEDFINGDDGTNGTISFMADEVAALEQGYVAVPVFRRDGGVGAVSVDFEFINGTAINGVDYDGTNGTISWSDNDVAIKYIIVRLLNVDENKAFTMQLSNPTGGAVLDPLLDEIDFEIQLRPGSRGFVGFEVDIQYTPHTTTFTATIYRFGGSRGAISVDYNTSDGSAVAGVDYTAASGTLNWANGETTPKTVNITIASPATAKNFFLNLSNPTGGCAIFVVTEPLEIEISGTGDDGNAGDLGFSVTQFQVGESQNLTLGVRRLNGKAGAISVNYSTADGTAVAGVNYTNTSGTLNWADNDVATKLITVPILTVTSNLTFTVSLDTPGGGASIQSGQDVANVLILDAVGTPPPVVPLYDTIIDEMFYTIGEAQVDGPFAYMNGNSHPLLWTAFSGGVGGWDGGIGSFGGGTDLVTTDGTLLPSMPQRFKIKFFEFN